MSSNIIKAENKKSALEVFAMEDFGGINKKKLPIFEILSTVPRGYSDSGKKHYEFADYIEEGDKFLREAKAEAEAIRNKAFREGYEDGLTQGLQQADDDTKANIEEFSKQLEEILSNVESFWVSMLESNREGIMRLIAETIKVIICGEVKTNPNVILNVLKKVFQKTKDSQKICLFISPKDLAMLGKHKKDIIEMLGKGKKLSISPDPELQQGGCRVEVENQGIEAGIETMVKEMEKNLLSEFI